MAGTATITAKLGPGVTNTAQVFSEARQSDVKRFTIDIEDLILTLTYGPNNKVITYDISAATTFTLTRSAGTFSLTIT